MLVIDVNIRNSDAKLNQKWRGGPTHRTFKPYARVLALENTIRNKNKKCSNI